MKTIIHLKQLIAEILRESRFIDLQKVERT